MQLITKKPNMSGVILQIPCPMSHESVSKLYVQLSTNLRQISISHNYLVSESYNLLFFVCLFVCLFVCFFVFFFKYICDIIVCLFK